MSPSGRRPRSPTAGLEGEEAAARVRAAVDALPEQQRLALVLARFHHCSYEEVAETMETSVPAVKSLLTRARENLRRGTAGPRGGRRDPGDAQPRVVEARES